MKKTSIFSIAAVALGLLGATFMSACNQPASKKASDSTTPSVESAASVDEEFVAYVNADSLSAKYEYFKDVREKLEAKIKKAQNDLQSKGQAFQREINEYQQKAHTMSADERQKTEERLARKQDELGQLDQNTSMSLAQDESTEMDKIYTSITEFLEKYSKEKDYKLVLTYSKANPTVLYIDPSFDITNQVIDELNAEYKKNKDKESKK